MVRVKRTDANQAEMVKQLEAWGFTVESLHMVGRGVPDLLVGLPSFNLLVEVKVPRGKLNELQVKWHAEWPGPVIVATSAKDVLEAVTLWPDLPPDAKDFVERLRSQEWDA